MDSSVCYLRGESDRPGQTKCNLVPSRKPRLDAIPLIAGELREMNVHVAAKFQARHETIRIDRILHPAFKPLGLPDSIQGNPSLARTGTVWDDKRIGSDDRYTDAPPEIAEASSAERAMS
jgi:hypothetical protein